MHALLSQTVTQRTVTPPQKTSFQPRCFPSCREVLFCFAFTRRQTTRARFSSPSLTPSRYTLAIMSNIKGGCGRRFLSTRRDSVFPAPAGPPYPGGSHAKTSLTLLFRKGAWFAFANSNSPLSGKGIAGKLSGLNSVFFQHKQINCALGSALKPQLPSSPKSIGQTPWRLWRPATSPSSHRRQ